MLKVYKWEGEDNDGHTVCLSLNLWEGFVNPECIQLAGLLVNQYINLGHREAKVVKESVKCCFCAWYPSSLHTNSPLVAMAMSNPLQEELVSVTGVHTDSIPRSKWAFYLHLVLVLDSKMFFFWFAC